MESRCEDLFMAKSCDRTRKERSEQDPQVNRIDVLPDDVLLDIFDLYVYTSRLFPSKREMDAWQSLVHVCRRWRTLVFQSPRRLNLRLYCSPRTRANDTLDVWPVLPLIVKGGMESSSDADNVIAALGHSNRVCQVDLSVYAELEFEVETVLAAMQVPFPELTHLRLLSRDKSVPVIPFPDSFLGGSAPRLRYFSLSGIPFLGVPNLLLSATHLVKLWLVDIPHSGYISPEAIVALLSALSSLDTLFLEFEYPESRPDSQSRSLPPLKRSIIPALNKFHFRGINEYLEELLTCIDAPQLNEMRIDFFHQLDFYCLQLVKFIDRTPTLDLRAADEARVIFDATYASVELGYRTFHSGFNDFRIDVLCRNPNRQLSSVGQLCIFSLPLLSTVEDLYIEDENLLKFWENGAIERFLWLQLLLPFTMVGDLYLSEEIVPGVVATLQQLGEDGITEVLPSLQNIFVEGLEESGPVSENIRKFVAARQLSGHPVSISNWDR